MTWVLLILGFICLFAGIFMLASCIDIHIKGISFNSEILGWGLTWTGGVLTFLMLFAKGVAWMYSLGG